VSACENERCVNTTLKQIESLVGRLANHRLREQELWIGMESDNARNDHILQAAQKLRRAIVAIAAADAIKVDAASSVLTFLGAMRTVRELSS